jgi:glycosyltransferase involved in cell wall biosynthesis
MAWRDMADRQMPDVQRTPLNLAYVMTHYPRVALTFIAGEIDEVEQRGGNVFPIVMNAPSPADVATDEARQRQKKSLYLKASPGRIAAAVLTSFMRHPIKMAALVVKAIRSAKSDLRLMARRLVHLAYAALTAQHCNKHGIRHLHAQFGLAPATIAWFSASILSFPRGAACTWSFTIHGFQDFVDEADARLDLKARSASFVICISDFTRSQLCRVAEPNLWKQFHVVRCGIDLAAFPTREFRPMRAVPRIVILGRLSPEKGHGILLEAARQLACEGIIVEIEIIGDGPFAETIRQQELALGLQGRVTYDGELLPDEVARRLADADLFCMASFSEGLPISIMEAMAVGVPVVTTWIGGIPELAVNEVTALTVPPGNSDALAAAIKRLVSDPALCEVLVTNARMKVEQMHSRHQNGAQLFSLLSSTAASQVVA